MKNITVALAAVVTGSLTAQLGLSFAPALFVTYLGTAIVVSAMVLSGLITVRIIGLSSS